MSLHRPALMKQTINLLEAVGRDEGMRPVQVLDRFLEAAFCALRGKTLAPMGSAWADNEAAYEKVFANLQKPAATKDRFAELLALCTVALDEKCADFLGPLWMEIGSSSSMGQFFTPHELSRLTAQMTLGDPRQILADLGRPYFTAQEPAAGMGGMVLAVAEIMREAGLDPAINAFWHMVELDYTVFRGCYVQTALAGIAGAVFHGNTLSLKMISSHYTPATLAFMQAHGLRNAPALEGAVTAAATL